MIDRLKASAPALPTGKTTPPTTPAKAGAASVSGDQRILTSREPESKVAKSFDYGPDSGKIKTFFMKKILLPLESLLTRISPGEWLARSSDGGKKGIRRLREGEFIDELKLPVTGVAKTAQGWSAASIPNPDDPSGRFDPYQFAPTLAFHAKEDSFPVLPDQDGDGDTETDVKGYQHGMIGGTQPMRGAVSVAKKGEYTVLTYSYFYVDNKAATYHVKDSSTVAVYLKPGEDGKLAPTHMYTSWHYGGNMSKWEDLKKDENGHPVIKVERGSHALRPLAKWEPTPDDGVVVAGDGTMKHDGKAMPNRLSWISPQDNFHGVASFRPGDPANQLLMDSYYRIYQERTNPIHPSIFGYGELPR